MEGKLSLSKMLTDCKLGESKTITLVVTPVSNDKDGFEADVEEVVDYEEEGEGESAKDAKEGGEPPEGDKMGKPMSRMAPAVKKALMAYK